MATDATGIAVALAGMLLAGRPAHTARTFGLQRAEILAALTNGLLLTGVSVWVLYTAAQRWSEPPEIEAGLLLAGAGVGLLANTVSLWVLRDRGEGNLNMRGAHLEVLGDLLGSMAVLVAGLVIVSTGYARADVLASVLIGLMILPRAALLLRDVLNVLLEATPRGVDLGAVRTHMMGVSGVVDVHDLHAWLITSGVPVLSAHVTVDDACIRDGRTGEVLDRLGECLEGHFAVEHCTFQVEPSGHQQHEKAQHA